MVTEHTYPACRFHRVVDYIVDDNDDNENNDENYENDNIVDFNDSRLAAESSAERFGATLVTAPITLPVRNRHRRQHHQSHSLYQR